jgi:hypothetical protein
MGTSTSELQIQILRKLKEQIDLMMANTALLVKALNINGYPKIDISNSGTSSIELKFNTAIVHTNTLISTDILTLTLESTTSTDVGEYIYSFTTGATAPTITWPIECKESIVISPNKKYLISFVRVSATKVFTFIDEEVL